MSVLFINKKGRGVGLCILGQGIGWAGVSNWVGFGFLGVYILRVRFGL